MTELLERENQLVSWLNKEKLFDGEKLDSVSGDASFRRYFRFTVGDSSKIAVDAPPQKEDSSKFISIARAYQTKGVPVPSVVAQDLELGFMCLQDFGDVLLADQLNDETCVPLYRKALSLLSDIQSVSSTTEGGLPKFDEQLLRDEFYLFSHWLIKQHLKLELSDAELNIMENSFDVLVNNFSIQPQAGVHRDFHSRNLMCLPDESLGVIDFQDAVIGPITYDAVSLLRDCYVRWPDHVVYGLLAEWHQKHFPDVPWDDLKKWFDLTGMQRHVKASGIFARLCHRDGKQSFLKDIPLTLQYIIDVGKQYPELVDFAALVEEKIAPTMASTL